jgi:hypothetical protein
MPPSDLALQVMQAHQRLDPQAYGDLAYGPVRRGARREGPYVILQQLEPLPRVAAADIQMLTAEQRPMLLDLQEKRKALEDYSASIKRPKKGAVVPPTPAADVDAAAKSMQVVADAVKRANDTVADQVTKVRKKTTAGAAAEAAKAINDALHDVNTTADVANQQLAQVETNAKAISAAGSSKHKEFIRTVEGMRQYLQGVERQQAELAGRLPRVIGSALGTETVWEVDRPEDTGEGATEDVDPVVQQIGEQPALPASEQLALEQPVEGEEAEEAEEGEEGEEGEAEGSTPGGGSANQPYVKFDRLISEVPKAPEISRILDAVGLKASRQNTTTPVNVQRLVAVNLLQNWMKKERYPHKKFDEAMFYKTIKQRTESVGVPEDMIQDAVAAVQAKRDELRRLYDETRFVEKDRAVLNMAGKMRRAKQQITGVGPATRSTARSSK